MRSPYHGFVPPYQLPSNIVYFHDWRYVYTGGYAWKGPHGEAVPMLGLGRVPAMHYEYRDMPLGISLEALPAGKSEPILSASAADACLFGGSLIREDGVYRLWYECWLKEDFGTGRVGNFNALKYAESGDGIHWKRPRIHAKHGAPESRNIVYGAFLTPQSGFHGGCVFKDPSAPPCERYKAFHYGTISAKALADYCRRFPDDVDPMVKPEKQKYMRGLYGAVSRDGFAWKAVRGPLLVQVSDTHNICEYDPVLKQYVAYIRTWLFNRRTIGRTVSSDFRHFSFPEEVFWPDAMQKPYNLWYANAKTVMPGASDYHIMFPLRWNLTMDRFDFHLAASPDNVVWGFVPGGPVCKPGKSGAWDAGVVAPGLGMTDLPGDRVGILYAGTPVPHKYPRRPPLGKLAWAYWQKGRLVALKAPLEGSFSTWPLKFKGRKAVLNFRTAMTGYIQVEALGDEKVLAGRSFADCDSIAGDELNRTVTWRGAADIGHDEDKTVSFRFRLRNAELFSLRFE